MFPKPPPLVPTSSASGISIYRDIYESFNFVMNQLQSRNGSFYYMERRKEYYTQINQILVRASLFIYHQQPSVVPHEHRMDPLSDLESEMIRQIHTFIHQYVVNYWGQLFGVDPELVRLIQSFLSFLDADVDTYSMRNILNIYRRYLPVETSRLEVQNTITAYLIVTEINYELKNTLFFKIFRSLLHPTCGISLETLSGSLQRLLINLQGNPEYMRVHPHLIFGNSNFFDIFHSRSAAIYDVYLDQLYLALRQVCAVVPPSEEGHLRSLMLEVMSVQTAWNGNRDLRVTLNNFYSTINLLCVNRNYSKEQLRNTFTYLIQMVGALENSGRKDLADELAKDVSEVMSIYRI